MKDDIVKVLIDKLVEANEKLGRTERELQILSEENNLYRRQLGIKDNNPFFRIHTKSLKCSKL